MIKSAVRLLRERSLLQKFALVSLVSISLLGLLLGQMLSASVQRQILDGVIAEAKVVSQLGLQRAIAPSELKNGLSSDRVRALQIALRTDFARINVVDTILWNLDRTIVFASDSRLIGQSISDSAALVEAIAGQPLAKITDVSNNLKANPGLRRHGMIVEVYQPVRFGSVDSDNIAGVLRTAIPYAPIEQTIYAETRRLYIALIFGLFTLYLVLFRLVANASAELRKRADENEQQARRDALTGLPNRTRFSEEIDSILSKRGTNSVAIALIDLDRFKDVNDTLGHHYGDMLLIEVGQRLSNLLNPNDLVARLGGDEFALILKEIDDTDAALAVVNRVAESIEQPFEIEGMRLDIGASIGVSIAPEHGDNLALLLQRADVAMYFAKKKKSRCALYNPSYDNNSRSQLNMLGELRRSMEDQLVVFYQPKVDLNTGLPSGVEALVRWDHPDRGILPPSVFVPLAERSGLMDAMTRIVLDKSLAQLQQWLKDGYDLHTSVNVSARSLHDGGLAKVVDKLLNRYEIPAERLVLEITETTIAADPVRAREVLVDMGKQGIRFSIDDFGTGYSSLAVLRSLPVNELKIDQEFIRDLAHPDGAAIVEFSIQLGHTLGLVVVAEGVEQASDQQELERLGCDLAQGYWYARPMPADELSAWMNGRQSIAA